MAASLVCPFDGVMLDAAGTCRRCGATWRAEADVEARGRTAFRRLAPDVTSAAPRQQRKLSCPACRGTLAPWRLADLQIWMYRCPLCEGWLCPRGTLETLSRLELQLGREAAFASFSPEERAEMARDLAAETAEAAPAPELSLVHEVLARCGLPVVTRIHRERLPLATWWLAVALLVAFIVELRGVGVEAAVAQLGYGPANRGLWAAVKATFVHAGWLHLFGNIYFLLAFGDGVEQRAPRWLLPPAFVVTGVAALLVDRTLHPDAVLVGASGGVAAVIGACVVLQPRALVVIHLWVLSLRLSMRSCFILQLLFQAVMAVAHVSGTAWTAHLVGLVLGAAGGALLLRSRRAT